MTVLLQQLDLFDRLAIQASQTLRWEPLTAVFVLASAAWVKGPLFVIVGAAGDLRAGRRLPVASALSLLSASLGSVLAFVIKEWTDRARPPLADAGIEPLVSTPQSPSFPSGHAATAFAAATVVAAFHPRLRVPVFALAALVALSRVYLGVHYWLDIVAGAALGVILGVLIAWAARALEKRFRNPHGRATISAWWSSDGDRRNGVPEPSSSRAPRLRAPGSSF
jgi:undecaprenyl-diphosphatase